MSNNENIIYTKFLDPNLFIDKSKEIIENYICPICKGVLNYPSMLKNGEVTCKNCLIKKYNLIESKEQNIISVNTIFEIIEKQKLNCKNKFLGCEFEGNVKEYRNHILNDCNNEMINCPFKNCNEKIFRSDLEDHKSLCDYRIIKCPKCEKIMKYKEIINHKNYICSEEEIFCPKKCGEKFKRKLLNEHYKKFCDNYIINCPYCKYGCRYPKRIRKEIKRHMKDAFEEHNELLLIYINESENENKKKINEIENKIYELENIIKENNIFIKKKRKIQNNKLFNDFNENNTTNENEDYYINDDFKNYSNNNNNNEYYLNDNNNNNKDNDSPISLNDDSEYY